MRSATAEPHSKAEIVQGPELAIVQYDAASGQEEDIDEGGEGGYKLTFNTSSICFAGTGAQVSACLVLQVQALTNSFEMPSGSVVCVMVARHGGCLATGC